MPKFMVQVKQTQVYEIEIEAENADMAEEYAIDLSDGDSELGNPQDYEYDAKVIVNG